MPVGATKKEKRQYEKIKKSAKKSGRYGGRAEEVAARTLMKKRRQKGKAGRIEFCENEPIDRRAAPFLVFDGRRLGPRERSERPVRAIVVRQRRLRGRR